MLFFYFERLVYDNCKETLETLNIIISYLGTTFADLCHLFIHLAVKCLSKKSMAPAISLLSLVSAILLSSLGGQFYFLR